MTTNRKVEAALRAALQNEDASVRRRLPTKPARPSTPALPESEPEVSKTVAMGEGDVARIAAIAERCLPTMGRSETRSRLLRAGVLALESMSDDAIGKLVARLPALEAGKSAKKGGKGKKR